MREAFKACFGAALGLCAGAFFGLILPGIVLLLAIGWFTR